MVTIPNKSDQSEKNVVELVLDNQAAAEIMAKWNHSTMQIFQSGWDGFHLIESEGKTILKLYDLASYMGDWAKARNGELGRFIAGCRCYRIESNGETAIIPGDIATMLHQKMTDEDYHSEVINYIESYIAPNPELMEEMGMTEEEMYENDFVSAVCDLADDMRSSNVPENDTIEAAIEQAAKTWRGK